METPRSDKRGRSGGAGARSLMPDDDKDDPMSARRGPNPFISNPHAHPQFAPQKLGARGVSERRAQTRAFFKRCPKHERNTAHFVAN